MYYIGAILMAVGILTIGAIIFHCTTHALGRNEKSIVQIYDEDGYPWMVTQCDTCGLHTDEKLVTGVYKR